MVAVNGPNAMTGYTNDTSSPQARAPWVTGYGDQAFDDGDASLSVRTGDAYRRIAVSPAGAPPSGHASGISPARVPRRWP